MKWLLQKMGVIQIVGTASKSSSYLGLHVCVSWFNSKEVGNRNIVEIKFTFRSSRKAVTQALGTQAKAQLSRCSGCPLPPAHSHQAPLCSFELSRPFIMQTYPNSPPTPPTPLVLRLVSSQIMILPSSGFCSFVCLAPTTSPSPSPQARHLPQKLRSVPTSFKGSC